MTWKKQEIWAHGTLEQRENQPEVYDTIVLVNVPTKIEFGATNLQSVVVERTFAQL